ncbi:MAG: AMP-binding protein [Verrucomicrobia bacterium]|nr:AMP-binding protein [Verrucomicrobiota bacterium]
MIRVSHAYPHLLGELLSATAARLPDKEALVFGDQRVSWSEFDRRANNLAKAFLKLGIQRGERIGVISTTRPEYLYTYLAAARIGAVLVGFSVLYTPTELVRLAQLTRPVAMVVLGKVADKKLAASIKPLIDRFSFVRLFVVIGDEAPAGAIRFDDLIAGDYHNQDPALAARKAGLQENEAALIVFTSGSTGVPKGAVLTHKNIIDNIAVQVRQFGSHADVRSILHLPMNHVAGSTETTIPALMTGATLVLMDHFHPRGTLETIQRERITMLGQVPTMFIMEFNLPDFAQFDLSTLRTVVVAGAATPAPVMARMMKLNENVTVITGYGMTEVGGFVTYTAPDDVGETIARTVGKVAPEFELRIVDDQHRELPTGQVGEVAIRGSCVMQGYFENPVETAAAIDAEGWFYSGDQGRLDARGYLTLVDRKKDMYITGGYNVYPREIEEHLSQHPQIAFVAVLGTKDDVMGEVGVAYVVARPGATLTADELKAHCKAGLAEYKIPRHFELQERLPLTPLGKVDKMKLRMDVAETNNANRD